MSQSDRENLLKECEKIQDGQKELSHFPSNLPVQESGDSDVLLTCRKRAIPDMINRDLDIAEHKILGHPLSQAPLLSESPQKQRPIDSIKTRRN